MMLKTDNIKRLSSKCNTNIFLFQSVFLDCKNGFDLDFLSLSFQLFVTAPTEDTFEVVAKTKNLGTWKVFEKYRTEGMDITMTVVETGLSLTEFWPRQK
jgi:hypothetical protein